MKLLTKFWMDTPVGRLEFNRTGPFTWEMYGTREQVPESKRSLPFSKVTAEDVISVFGWPEKGFKPYGEIHEEVEEQKAVKKVQPLFTLHGKYWGKEVEDDTLFFASKEDLDAYVKQQKEGEES